MSDQITMHEFPLRQDVLVRLAIPRNLTAKEADRLSEWIHLLVIPEEIQIAQEIK